MEQRKFDLNSIIGFALIFVILIFIMYQNQPDPKVVAAEKAKKELSIKEAKAKELEAKTVEIEEKADSYIAEALEAKGISAEVINIHTIKPIDEELIVAAAKETGKVVTVEEHSVIGGLGSAVCDVLSEKLPTPVLKIGVMDTFGESGPAVELIKKYGLDADSICEKVKAFVK